MPFSRPVLSRHLGFPHVWREQAQRISGRHLPTLLVEWTERRQRAPPNRSRNRALRRPPDSRGNTFFLVSAAIGDIMRRLAPNGNSAKAVRSVGQLDVQRGQIWPAAAAPFRAAF